MENFLKLKYIVNKYNKSFNSKHNYYKLLQFKKLHIITFSRL